MDDNFETVPFSYLRADRRLFVNTQFMLQLDDVDNPNTQKGRHWFVDALAYEPGTEAVYLCEFTFSRSLQGLKKRLEMWSRVWPEILAAIQRDALLHSLARPWAFVPEDTIPNLVRIARQVGFDGEGDLPPLKVTSLEMTLPWKYRFWNRIGEADKPATLPREMW